MTSSTSKAMKSLWRLTISFLQKGHLSMRLEHRRQTLAWPHGTSATWIGLSMQTAHTPGIWIPPPPPPPPAPLCPSVPFPSLLPSLSPFPLLPSLSR